MAIAIGNSSIKMKGNIMVSSVGGSQISSWASSLYSKLDTTNKGYIEKSDLSTAFSKLSGSNSSTSTDSIFSQLDGDSDGKVTKDEMTTALQQLSDSLNSQFESSRTQGGRGSHGDRPPPPPDGNAPPPPPAEGADSAGFTKDQLTAQLDEIGSTDSKRSELISKIVENFDKADTDGDGKVSMTEAMAYDQSTKSDSTSTASTSTDSTSSTASTASTTASNSEADVLMQIMRLMQAYQVIGQDDKHTGSGIFASA
jgi:Ca2+-binding EF-hand superfamily protein